MLLSKTVMVKWNAKIKKHYVEKGYVFTKMGDEFEVKVEDLTNGSHVVVEVECDGEDCNHSKLIIPWKRYKACKKDDNRYYCAKCSSVLYGSKKISETKFKSSKSFKHWCIENSRQDILDRWDYELNNCKPSEITYKNDKKYWFKCPRNIHDSEFKKINDLTSNKQLNINCHQCNSFAQWGIDNLGEDFLEKYWDYEKNKVNPYDIGRGSGKRIWVRCQEKDYHESYNTSCNEFLSGNRCPYCNNKNGRVHPRDSVGQYIIDNFGEDFLNKVWSDKNDKSPFEYAPKSDKIVWWKCPEEEHEDYRRKIGETNRFDFRCPSCRFSKGEKKIEEYLEYKGIKLIPQKKYHNLIGIGGGKLSYDFYLPSYNLLIEYQGEFHDGSGNYFMKQNLERQQEHDRRKKEYAKNNNIELLEIWYWDYDNIEQILKEKLNL